MIQVGIIAPSSVIPKIEFEIGADYLAKNGFELSIHPSVYGQHYFYSGSDEARAQAILDFAFDPGIQAIWAARGGYGATHLLPLLEKATRKKKPKKKTFLGYSDSTALMEFMRTRWGWDTIHAPMPSLRTFSLLQPGEWNFLMDSIRHSCLKKPVYPVRFELEPVYLPKKFKNLEAPVVGGNLAVWNSLLGTPYVGNARGKILFFEEISENVARINRFVHHLEQAGGFKGVKAVVLGDFTDCNDTAPQVLQIKPNEDEHFEEHLRHPKNESLGFLRSLYEPWEALDFVFRSLGERNQIAVFKGLPIGHGKNHFSLSLGKKHQLKKDGTFIQLKK